MKWAWVLIIMLWVPVSASAERPALGGQVNMVGEKFAEPTPPYALRFLLYADQNIENIQPPCGSLCPSKEPARCDASRAVCLLDQ